MLIAQIGASAVIFCHLSLGIYCFGKKMAVENKIKSPKDFKTSFQY